MATSVMQLRRIAKEWDCRQYGLKKTIVSRIYLCILQKVEDEHVLPQNLISQLPNFQTWLSNARSKVLSWGKPPSRDELLKILGAMDATAMNESEEMSPESRLGVKRAEKPEMFLYDSELSLSEFARLVMLLKMTVGAKRGTFKESRQVLNEEEKVECFTFWHSIVEPTFNDKAFVPVLDVNDALDGINIQELPLRFRTAELLMEAFVLATQSFLIYYERWQRTRSGDPELFKEVLPRNGPGGGISRKGMRALIIFKCMECWKGNEDVLLLGLLPHLSLGASSRGVKGGVLATGRATEEEDGDATDLGSDDWSMAPLKRRRRDSGKEDDRIERGEYLKGIMMMQAMKILTQGSGMMKRSTSQTYREKEYIKQEARMKLVQEQTQLMKSMEEARRMIREHVKDEEFRRLAEKFYNQLKRQFILLPTNCEKME